MRYTLNLTQGTHPLLEYIKDESTYPNNVVDEYWYNEKELKTWIGERRMMSLISFQLGASFVF